jgi:hypothetical protein
VLGSTAHQVLLYCQTFDWGFSPVSWDTAKEVRAVVLAPRVTAALCPKKRTSPMARARASAVMNKSLGVDRSRNVRLVQCVFAVTAHLLALASALPGVGSELVRVD